MDKNELMEFEVFVKAETEKALLVQHTDTDGVVEECWIPRSQIDEEDTTVVHEGDSGSLTIPMWLAEAKGLA